MASVTDPDPYRYFSGPPGSGSINTNTHPDPAPNQAKLVRKILSPTGLWLLYDILSSKNDIDVAWKSNKQNFFTCHLEGHWRKNQDPVPNPDLLVRATDPRIRICKTASGEAFLTI